LFKEYVLSGKIPNNRKDLDYTPRSPSKLKEVPDEAVLAEYEEVINGRKTIKEASENLELSYGTVWHIFRGDTRKHLGLNYRRDLRFPLKGSTRRYDREKAISLIRSGVPSGEFIQIMNCSYGYYSYIKGLLEDWSNK
jgi:hypothetical protein